jgi:alkanesulfonate monooxygenase SsuD/methylene tetrahydromethanopterin reductase-like flavin-dependent oxidoreductase (luciferase family)
LLTSVLVVPHRPAMLTAKMLATIDVLAKGRLIVGRRGLDEGGIRAWVSSRTAQGHRRPSKPSVAGPRTRPPTVGEHVRFDVLFYPSAEPHPPIWSAASPAARGARRGVAMPGIQGTTADEAARYARAPRRRHCRGSGWRRRRDGIRPPRHRLLSRTSSNGAAQDPGRARGALTGVGGHGADAASLEALGAGHVALGWRARLGSRSSARPLRAR